MERKTLFELYQSEVKKITNILKLQTALRIIENWENEEDDFKNDPDFAQLYIDALNDLDITISSNE